MRRRELLGAIGTVAVAGCTSLDGGGGDDSGTRTRYVSSSFSAASGNCGTQTDEEPEVEFNKKDLTVSVSGVLNGRDTCETAEIASAEYSSDDDSFRVEIETVKHDTDKMCAQCITEIEYSAKFGFEGGLPSKVTVVESDTNGTESTTVLRSGS
ncbi:MAG: hypothetical protein SV253_10045 [Halobacteria archaeon]|nr:hypothetical protein [Halobacteria archaeon]